MQWLNRLTSAMLYCSIHCIALIFTSHSLSHLQTCVKIFKFMNFNSSKLKCCIAQHGVLILAGIWHSWNSDFVSRKAGWKYVENFAFNPAGLKHMIFGICLKSQTTSLRKRKMMQIEAQISERSSSAMQRKGEVFKSRFQWWITVSPLYQYDWPLYHLTEYYLLIFVCNPQSFINDWSLVFLLKIQPLTWCTEPGRKIWSKDTGPLIGNIKESWWRVSQS